MTIEPIEDNQPSFTREQKQALGRVYGFLIDLGRQRLRRQNSGRKSEACLEEDAVNLEDVADESKPNSPT